MFIYIYLTRCCESSLGEVRSSATPTARHFARHHNKSAPGCSCLSSLVLSLAFTDHALFQISWIYCTKEMTKFRCKLSIIIIQGFFHPFAGMNVFELTEQDLRAPDLTYFLIDKICTIE